MTDYNNLGYYAKTPPSQWHRKNSKKKTYFQKMRDDIKKEQLKAELAEAKEKAKEAERMARQKVKEERQQEREKEREQKRQERERRKAEAKPKEKKPVVSKVGVLHRVRNTPANIVLTEDLARFLAEVVRDKDGEPVPYNVCHSFVKIIFATIGDLMVEHARVDIKGFGMIYSQWNQRNMAYYTKMQVAEELHHRVNVSEKHLTLQTERVIDRIVESRSEHEQKKDYMADYQNRRNARLREEREREKNDNENLNPNENV